MSNKIELKAGDTLRVVGDTLIEFKDLIGNVATLHILQGEELMITMKKKQTENRLIIT